MKWTATVQFLSSIASIFLVSRHGAKTWTAWEKVRHKYWHTTREVVFIMLFGVVVFFLLLFLLGFLCRCCCFWGLLVCFGLFLVLLVFVFCLFVFLFFVFCFFCFLFFVFCLSILLYKVRGPPRKRFLSKRTEVHRNAQECMGVH
jgi:hypothetical protein